MPNAFVRKLRRFAELSDEEVTLLVEMVSTWAERPGGTDLVREGDRPQATRLLLSGWACRYKMLPAGNRQIVGFLLPGDTCDLHVTLLDVMDHGIALVADSRVVALTTEALESAMRRHQGIATALHCSTLVDEAILREWLTSAGRRDAYARVGHLICELWHRLKAIGQVDEREQFHFPLTQEQLADALGLTGVHVNRMLRKLREDRLVTLGERRLRLLDPERLAAVSGFDPTYLHQGKEKQAPSRRFDRV